ncbi:MAG: tetratricopeptide repeat protein [Oscillatoria sp. SIO1A7]|nr:tetratricopeptide repeat protein [Oscillatoria sp. SIO1A7]
MYELIGLLIVIFMIWMVVDCIQNEPERQIWIWLLIFLNIIGAIAYFCLRYLPRLDLNNYNSTYQQKLWQAEAAVENIGKDHQYVELGNILYEMGMLERSASAYQTAIEKNPQNLKALWGAAQVALKMKKRKAAKKHLQILLKIEPDYKFGDASRLYAKTLIAMGHVNTARKRLEQNVKRWNNPEDRFLAAELALEQGDNKAARKHLKTMIGNLKGSPSFHYSQNTHLIKKAEKLLKKLKT